ncbi:DNA cytosine methyltransferase [Sphingopyxis sp. 550A]
MKLKPATEEQTITHAHLFCGIGVGARGFNLASPRVANIRGRFKCLGGIDVDAGAIRNFKQMTGVPGTVMDLFDLEQYRSFHGKDPSPGWREATPLDIWMAFGSETPDVMFLSAPCKGFSGLLASAQSKTDKYQALNALTLRGIWLTLEAYKDDPIPIILFENVPRIQTRGRWLLDQIIALLRSYGYSVNEDTHDCGVIGGLAQSRKRFLLIARHSSKIPPFVYQPTHHRLRGVGEVIGKLPLPGDPIAGPMHRVPALQWKTWVRLAFVPAGKDWRSLNDLAVVDGQLRDFGIVPEVPLRDNALGVNHWNDSAPVITTHRAPGQGRFSVADPRVDADWNSDVLGVRDWEKSTGTVAGRNSPTNGAFSVADPRPGYGPNTHQNILAVAGYDEAAKTIGSAAHVAGGALSVADPRPEGPDRASTYGVREWLESSGTIQGESFPTNGAFSVADPRPGYGPATHRHVLGVNDWDGAPTGTINGDPKPSTGAFSVADPRPSQGNQTYQQYGVKEWEDTSVAVSGQSSPGGGPYSVADPRLKGKPRFNNTFRIVGYNQTSVAVAGPGGPAGGAAVADPRPDVYASTKYKVTRMDEAARTVIGASTTGDGAFAVADPRPDWNSDRHANILRVTPDDEPAGTITGNAHSVTGGQACVADRRAAAFPVQDPRAFGGTAERGHYQTGGHYGVVAWQQTGYAVSGSAGHDNGFNSVADPREAALDADPITLPQPEDRLVCRIISTDNTWHRPFTTLDLAALQSLFDPEEVFEIDPKIGAYVRRWEEAFDLNATSDVTKREWIGNAVPGAAATGMAETIGETIILARIGETFQLSTREIWVKPGALALAVDNDQLAFRMDGGLA